MTLLADERSTDSVACALCSVSSDHGLGVLNHH